MTNRSEARYALNSLRAEYLKCLRISGRSAVEFKAAVLPFARMWADGKDAMITPAQWVLGARTYLDEKAAGVRTSQGGATWGDIWER